MMSAEFPNPDLPPPRPQAGPPALEDESTLILARLVQAVHDLERTAENQGNPELSNSVISMLLSSVNAAGKILSGSERPEPPAHGSGEARRALRFRDVAPFDPLLSNISIPLGPEKPAVILPSARLDEVRPYLRPFLKQTGQNEWEIGWGQEGARWWRPLVAVALLLLTVSVTFLAWFSLTRSRSETSSQPGSPSTRAPTPDDIIREEMPNLEASLRAFHTAATPSAKANYVRGGVSMLPVMQEYYHSHEVEPSFLDLQRPTVRMVPVATGTVLYGLFTLADGNSRQFTAQVTSQGCLLDWQSLTGWTGMEWDAYLQARSPKPHLLCASAVPETYYTGPYADDKTWICLRLEDSLHSQHLWAYVRRDTPNAQKLPAAFQNVFADSPPGAVPSPRRITVEGHFAPDAAGTVPLWEVTKVCYDGWFDPDLTTAQPASNP